MILRLLRMFSCVACLLTGMNATAQECGEDGRCLVDGGYYLAVPPSDWDGVSPLGAVVYFHGWNSSPEASLRNKAMLRGVHERSAMLVLPFARTGYWRQIGRNRAEPGRDELAYVKTIMADLHQRYPIDEKRILASGFSRGASLVWNLACYAGDLFSGFAPIAGGFWRSNPENCPTGPVKLRHIHGTADKVVAFDEYGIYGSMDIGSGMDLLRRHNGCTSEAATSRPDTRLTCSRWQECTGGGVLELCTHGRGHSIRAEWVGQGLDWLDDLNGTAKGRPDQPERSENAVQQ